MKNKKKSIFSYKITYFIIALLLFLLPYITHILGVLLFIYYPNSNIPSRENCFPFCGYPYNTCNFSEIVLQIFDIFLIVIHILQFILPILTIIFGIIYTIKSKDNIKKNSDKKSITILSILFIIIFILLTSFNYIRKYCYLNQNNYVKMKPILYIYPKEDMNVKVTLEKEENLLTTYPKYNNGWEVLVKQNGDMYDKNGKYYYALYWDEKSNNTNNFEEGFYVTKENAIDFLEEKLTYIGLNDKEKNEFIMYWLPIIEKNEKNIINFELTEELQKDNKITITPKPDSFLRVHINIKKVDKKVNIKNQKLKPFNRTGYTAVEWGGTNY